MSLILANLIDKVGVQRILLKFDIDLTLRNTMCRNTPKDQQLLIAELYERTHGGIIFMSGRSQQGIDETFHGLYPLSSEHHAAIRLEKGGDIISLAPKIDTQEIANKARKMIDGRIDIVSTAQAVRDSEGHVSVVFPEVKDYAVALVHSLGHDNVEYDRGVLQEVAQQILADMDLTATHKMAVGSDAIEIVPKALAKDSLARQILSSAEIERLDVALNKGVAVHNFMSLSQYSDRVPYVVGDSGTDGVAMLEAQKYGGGGVWVKNGKDVPEQFRDAVNGYQIKSFIHTWDHITTAVEHLRDRAPIVKVTASNVTDIDLASAGPAMIPAASWKPEI